jgi:hypothetical protein
VPEQYEFNQHIANAYLKTHEWLRQRNATYVDLNYQHIRNLLTEETLESAAGQFCAFFPAHYFKVQHILDEIITPEKLALWLAHNRVVCILDVGCGAGAGSTAFIDTLISLYQSQLLTNPVDVYCIGIDPNPHALVVYNQMLKNVSDGPYAWPISLNHKIIPGGFPSVTTEVVQELQQIATQWDRPNLPHLFVMQLNVVSPFKQMYAENTKDYEILRQYGVESPVYRHGDFGENLARAYLQIFATSRVDHMHIFTIGTRNYQLDKHIAEMGSAMCKTFEQNTHSLTIQGSGEQSVTFYNPKGSLHEAKREPHPTTFHAHILTIKNDELRGDREWQEVIELDNLKLAWVRARRELMREAFVDEVEIRLFEADLETNLQSLQRQLMAYAEDVARHDDYVAYKVPKNASQTRPRGLSRFEEEILSIAIIQRLGQVDSQTRLTSYAHRLTTQSRGRDTEYLYAPWFSAYAKYREDARNAAQRCPNGMVIKTDIRSFYTRIIQAQLIEATREIVQSDRVRWLIKLLLSKNINGSDLNQGLVQGGIASGFFANLYLKPIDVALGSGNTWQASLFRYADDMVVVIPQQEDGSSVLDSAQEILAMLREKLGSLGLELNEDKTAILTISDFLEQTQPDAEIEAHKEAFDRVLSGLWILNDSLRQKFIQWKEDDNLWWHWIKQYQICLQRLGVFVDQGTLSRYIAKYLFHESRRKKDLSGDDELDFPDLPRAINEQVYDDWLDQFVLANKSWCDQYQTLREQMTALFLDNIHFLYEACDLTPLEEERYQRRLRFALNRLREIGLAGVLDELLHLLTHTPWHIRDLLGTFNDLGRQQIEKAILDLVEFYRHSNEEMAEYLRVCLISALGNLHTIQERHWQIVVDFAKSGSLVERLAALEVWLKLSTTAQFRDYKSAAEEICSSIDRSRLASRIKKSYLLLFQEYDISCEIDITHDPLIQSAIKQKGQATSLFDYAEPNAVMDYYSGMQEGDRDREYSL